MTVRRWSFGASPSRSGGSFSRGWIVEPFGIAVASFVVAFGIGLLAGVAAGGVWFGSQRRAVSVKMQDTENCAAALVSAITAERDECKRRLAVAEDRADSRLRACVEVDAKLEAARSIAEELIRCIDADSELEQPVGSCTYAGSIANTKVKPAEEVVVAVFDPPRR